MSLFKKTRSDYRSAPEFGIADRNPDRGFFRVQYFGNEKDLYYSLRENVPVIDACLTKIIRLIGGFKAAASEKRFQDDLDNFVTNVTVGASGRGLNTFIDCYTDSLLTSGSALCEIVRDENGRGVSNVYVAPMRKIDVKVTDGEREYFLQGSREPLKISNGDNIVFTALSPTPEQPCGVSILRGLPSISAILLRIYDCIGQNFDRLGNVRYAVTYKPSADAGEKAFAKERAQQIAREWSNGMNASRNGEIKDFIAVGDISVKAIGADNQIIDTEVPVRQLLEQLISKLGIPPFLLGLNWSTSERMSSQQADILTSELEYYRRLLTPSLEKICSAHLRLLGSSEGAKIVWDVINLQDETEMSLARLRNAQARAIEISNMKEEGQLGKA